MTCPECGAPLDPDVTHTQHTDGCDHLEDCGFYCDCPEVCADCCQTPDCPLRQPQETNDG